MSYDAGAQARAELILDHLDLWKKWSTIGGGPFGTSFVGRSTCSNVGLMGHSRGGEGVARAAVLNADRGGQYGIRAVLPLAPTDFARATVPGVAMSVVLPYCDGDVSDLQGQKFYDDTRYSVGRRHRAAVDRDGAGREPQLLQHRVDPGPVGGSVERRLVSATRQDRRRAARSTRAG